MVYVNRSGVSAGKIAIDVDAMKTTRWNVCPCPNVRTEEESMLAENEFAGSVDIENTHDEMEVVKAESIFLSPTDYVA